MFSELISHSEDLRALVDAGYALSIRGAYLVISDIPYVTEERKVARGALASTLNLSGPKTLQPDQHQIYFIGNYPCHSDGTRMEELVNQASDVTLDGCLIAKFQFSRMPDRGYYEDYFEKIVAYEELLSSQAEQLENVSARTRRVVEAEESDDYPFNYLDTASARAEINPISRKLALPAVGIIGLGGTGAYVLDLVAKTHVREIHLFDGDYFANHNAFRAPGAASLDDLRLAPNKAQYFADIYGRMRRRIVPHPYYVNESNAADVDGLTFAFLCFDPSPAKLAVVDALENRNIPFIDVGLGLRKSAKESIMGMARVTTSEEGHREDARAQMAFDEMSDEDPYESNIQVADLNCLNAALAVVRWKKLYGFYADLENEHNTTYSIDCNMLSDDVDD